MNNIPVKISDPHTGIHLCGCFDNLAPNTPLATYSMQILIRYF